ncbi:MAG: response regulator transcription factor [Deltaproteobacteria bacterium]|nr:response regulator transcription factor [Deltaproteobacteria bacterium]
MKPSPGHTILLVEDEIHIAQGLIFNLEQEGCHVIHAATAHEAWTALERMDFSLLILDVMLPDGNGFDICRSVRERDGRIPILFLTALGDEAQRINGLAHGADDYLTKPFSLTEFLLRVKRMLERSDWYRPSPASQDVVNFGGCRVDFKEGKALTLQGEIGLTDLEMKILRIFFSREGEILERSELLASVWGLSPETETRTLDNFIARLRKYFEADPSHPEYFLTVRGKGYRFVSGQ